LLARQRWADRLDLQVGARIEDYRLSSSGRGAVGNASSADFYVTPAVQELIGAGLTGAGATSEARREAGAKLVGPVNPGRIFTGTLDDSAWYPSVALTWSPLPRLNVRASYTETVARPSFRELGPYFTRDEVSDEYQHGNVFLQTSAVRNADFRIEYFFPRSRDVVALSLFEKRIERPIERAALVVDLVSRSTASWFNNPNAAELRGVEFEVAKNLGFLGEVGGLFTVGGNGTFIAGEVVRNSNEPVFPGADPVRSLYDQPEWIANAYVTFELPQAGFSTTLSWFAISDVLQKVGVATWSTFTAQHDRFDLSINQRLGRRWQLRLTAKNLADPDRKYIADPDVTTEEIVLRKFRDGRSYSLTTTYEF
jgi:outer membrane receptor protein involved in Fe transport